MQRTKPPFRADEVGSLLRPQRIKDARAKFEKGQITAADLRKAEDMEIEKVVHRQSSTGLKVATDGEFRRSWWHFDFLKGLTGCELFHPSEGIQFAGVQTRHDAVLLSEEGRQHMPRVDLVVLEAAGDVLRVGDGLTRHDGEFGKIHEDRFRRLHAKLVPGETPPGAVPAAAA